MIRRTCALLAVVALLAACGGGGGSTSVVPKPASPGVGKATFVFKIPAKATLAKLRRPAYVSQATAGVGIDWSSSDPTHPDYSAAITATCPGTFPVGVTACSIDAQGGTDYTFELPIPFGTYTFTVSTFDSAPSAGAFTGHLLAQGQLAAPVAISAGAANVIPALTFYGVPASVSFVPAEGQSHVAPFSNGTATYAVIGNSPQTFYAQSVDADGFAIASSDPGAPVISVAEGTGDLCAISSAAKPCFTVTNGSKPYQFMLQAESAAGDYANIVATATPGGGLAAASSLYTIAAVQEVWTTQAGGSPATYGVSGYALYPGPGPTPVPTTNLTAAIDYANPQICAGQCNWYNAAMDPSGNIWVMAQNYGMYEFKQGPASTGVIAPTAPTAIPIGLSPQSMTIDANGYLYLDDSTGTVSVYNTNAPSATPTTVINDTNGVPESIAIAPASSGAIAGDIFVGDTLGITVFGAYHGGATAPAQIGQITTGVGNPFGLAFDPTGALWEYDGSNSLIEVGTATATSVSFHASATPLLYDGAVQIGVTAEQTAFMGGPGSLNGLDFYSYVGGTIANTGSVNLNLPSVWSVMIAP